MPGAKTSAPARGTTAPVPSPDDAKETRHRTVKEQLGNRLRELRKKHGFTIDALAEYAAISGDMVSKLERAEVGGSTETWSDLATALNEPLDALFQLPKGGSAARASESAPYLARLKGAEPATPVQVQDLATAAAALDRDAVSALLTLARRLRRSGT